MEHQERPCKRSEWRKIPNRDCPSQKLNRPTSQGIRRQGTEPGHQCEQMQPLRHTREKEARYESHSKKKATYVHRQRTSGSNGIASNGTQSPKGINQIFRPEICEGLHVAFLQEIHVDNWVIYQVFADTWEVMDDWNRMLQKMLCGTDTRKEKNLKE